jgi:serine phosphatase RsbU (regulator of sigma subunit)
VGLKAALDRLGVGVYAVDAEERIVEVNARGAHLLARAADGLIGRDAREALHRDRQGRVAAGGDPDRAVSAGRPVRAERAWFARGDGSLLPVSWFRLPCEPDDQGAHALVFFHDLGPEGDAGPAAPGARTLSQLERLALLADTTAQLISNIDVQQALWRVVGLMLPRIADWAVIDLITQHDEVTRELVVHAEPAGLVAHEELQGPMPPVIETSTMPLSKALRGVTSTLVGPQTYAGEPDTGITVEQQKLFEVTGIETAAIVPIRGPSEVVGALTLGRSAADEAFTAGDLAVVEDIARRIGIALENWRHYQRQRQVAETMQRYLLPHLPHVPGVEMTARYLPAPDASHVGGDWYDAFPLPSGDTAVVVGDVLGHDLEAAAGMAQLRNMLRAYAWSQEQPPHGIVERLAQAMEHVSDVLMATMILARLSRDREGGWELLWTSAGHPPPLLVDHTGVAHYLEEGNGVLLGADARVPRSDARVGLPPGSTLVLYTDGLIESRDRSLDSGLDNMRRHAAALAHRPLEVFADQLLRRARPAGNDDDVALLVIRIPR